MNSLPRKIVACLIVVIIGISFGPVTVDAVGQCMNKPCFFCNGIPITHKQLVHTDDSAGRMCHSSSVNIPCNLKQNMDVKELVFIVSSVKEERLKIDDFPPFFIHKPFLMQAFRENVTTNRFWITTDHTPIYLQNLSLLC
jgi:hypothetical protein